MIQVSEIYRQSLAGALSQCMQELNHSMLAGAIYADGAVWLTIEDGINEPCKNGAWTAFYEDACACFPHCLDFCDELHRAKSVFHELLAQGLGIIGVWRGSSI